MKKRSKIWILLIGIVLLIGIGKVLFDKKIENIQKLGVSMPDLSDIQDGKYLGEYSVFPVYVKVEVSIKNHQLTNIALLQHDHGLGGTAERLVDEIIEKQTLDVDVVTHATVSSKCILKAVENALIKE